MARDELANKLQGASIRAASVLATQAIAAVSDSFADVLPLPTSPASSVTSVVDRFEDVSPEIFKGQVRDHDKIHVEAEVHTEVDSAKLKKLEDKRDQHRSAMADAAAKAEKKEKKRAASNVGKKDSPPISGVVDAIMAAGALIGPEASELVEVKTNK